MQLFNTKVIPSETDRLWTLPDHITTGLKEASLLVVSSPFDDAGPGARTLQKMMAACRLRAPEFIVLKLLPEQNISWQLLAADGAPRRILMLGVPPSSLGIHAMFRINYCNSFLGATFIPSYTLEQLEQQAGYKRELWESGLKPCFGL